MTPPDPPLPFCRFTLVALDRRLFFVTFFVLSFDIFVTLSLSSTNVEVKALGLFCRNPVFYYLIQFVRILSTPSSRSFCLIDGWGFLSRDFPFLSFFLVSIFVLSCFF